MTGGLLLDTHALIWLMEEMLDSQVAASIAEYIENDRVFASNLLAWELGCSARKKNESRRPNLQGLTVRQWTALATGRYSLQWLPISHEIALEAAEVPAIYGSGDPGDCFLIATARVHGLTLVTRDERMLALAAEQPEYLTALRC